jgi:ABC-type polysaccharide/polyol phosphate export permease
VPARTSLQSREPFEQIVVDVKAIAADEKRWAAEYDRLVRRARSPPRTERPARVWSRAVRPDGATTTVDSRWKDERLFAARRSWEVLAALIASDLRARYGRGRFRLLKWLLDPFALVGVYLLLVTFVLDRPGEAPGLSLACAVIPFQLVMMSVTNGIGAVRLRRSILLNTSFPGAMIPLSGALTEAVAFAASISLPVLMMIVYDIQPTAAVLWLPVVLVVNLLLAIAAAYAGSLLGLWFRELRPFLISFVRALFFLAPGLVPLSEVGGEAYDLLRLNPLTGLFEAYRAVLLEGHAPAAWELLYPSAIALLMLAAFLPLYRREAKHFAKVV